MAVLFGSRAKGTARNESDFDIAVFTRPEGELARNTHASVQVILLLSRYLKIPSEKIDLSNPCLDDPLLMYEIFHQGTLIFGSELDFLEYRAMSYRNYIDAKDFFALSDDILKKNQERLREKIKAYDS